ncbi:sulfite exporter TauE/SafE family protein [Marinobacter sp. M3C]|uniref:sulfite exporter TauE/SafE family protein n=2 Tax=unclassified Marinobacter TaxID=83889 RepID=UPI0024B364D9|nr:sulfite exporter TauE/SafE family protein [Marinobacter sp. M3C]
MDCLFCCRFYKGRGRSWSASSCTRDRYGFYWHQFGYGRRGLAGVGHELGSSCVWRSAKAYSEDPFNFFFAATASVFLGSWMSTFVDSEVPSLILATVLLFYSFLGLMRVPITISKDHGRVVSIGMGICNGILTGVTGSSAVPGVFYLQSIFQSRDMLIQAMGILFSLSSIALAATLYWRGFLTLEIGLLSVLSLFPAFVGMALGSAVRKKIPSSVFLHLFYFALFSLGSYILYSNLNVIIRKVI